MKAMKCLAVSLNIPGPALMSGSDHCNVLAAGKVAEIRAEVTIFPHV